MSVDWLDILPNSSTVTNLQTNVLDNERELYYSEILYEYFSGKFSIWLKNHMQNAHMCTRRSKRRCMQGVMISFKYNNDTYNRFFQSFDFIIPVTELLVDLIDIKWWHIYLKSVSDFNVIYTTVIAKIKWMPRSLFYVIPRYVTMDYEKWHTSLLLTQCEDIRAFEVQNHVN